jgi:hypothetical protein
MATARAKKRKARKQQKKLIRYMGAAEKAAIGPAEKPSQNARTLGRVREGVDLVSEADPDGYGVVHERNRRQRMVDALHDDRAITDDQHATASAIRDAWERCRHIQHLRACCVDTPRVDGGGGDMNESDPALRLYEGVMRQVGREARHCITAVVLHDEHPTVYGKRMNCHGMTALHRHLDRAAKQVEMLQ